jgi:hypothetical protein
MNGNDAHKAWEAQEERKRKEAYKTRSADLTAAGAPSYSWGGQSLIVGSWSWLALQNVTAFEACNHHN